MEGKPAWGEAPGWTFGTSPAEPFIDGGGAGRWEELRPLQEEDCMVSFAALCRGLLILQPAREAVKENLAFWTRTSRPGTRRVAGTISWSLQVYHSICRRVQDVNELSPASNGENKIERIVIHLNLELLGGSVFSGGGTHEFRGTPEDLLQPWSRTN
ncbi:hypothetical protein FQA47_025310 [Oryzias melastigma]|uniref:Uncharacterized protein n=1 Tax=Oryzias melastigma TaxID=30732 RepID=A0A834FRS4_ORYME|nr:hypothetical protein FQA47_025310 [Oryzias melastigma]